MKTKKFPYVFQLGCILVGIAVLLITFFVWKDYFTADVRFRTEAYISDIKISTKTKLRNKDDVNYSQYNKYETYYDYDVTWKFQNVLDEKYYTYSQSKESSSGNAYKIGDKETIFVYYNNGQEDDFEILEMSYTVIFLIVGGGFIGFGLVSIPVDLIRRKRKLKRVY